MRRFGRKSRIRRRWCLLLLVLVLAAAFLDARAADWLLTYGEQGAKATAARVVSEAVAATLESGAEPVTVLQRDESGNVTSLQTDTAAVSRLQATVTERLLAAFEDASTAAFSVPMGTLLGGAWISGRGPNVTFYLQRDGDVVASPREAFTSAGINQSCHTVYLDVQMTLLVTAAGCQRSVELTVPAIVSQTVLVGGVPGTYVNVDKSA